MKTIRAVSDLPAPTETSISIITPPKVRCLICPVLSKMLTTGQVTLGVLEQAKALGVPALWLQPGAEDAAVIAYVKENGLEDKVIYGGPCILVEGDNIISSL